MLALPLALSGCLFSTRKLPVPKKPATIQTATAEELVNRLNQRWNGLQSLTAKVEIQASVLHSDQGVAKDYTSIPGIILMRKPEMLRVYGRVPVIGTELFDMVSDGKNFTLFIPSKSKAVKGSNDSEKKNSTNPLENLRPGFFFDSLAVRGLDPADRYLATADEDVVEDAQKKNLYSISEYVLSIHRPKPGSAEDTPLRVVHFHREDLLPYQQDIYDSKGNLATQVFYANYGDFGGNKYPAKVTIKRPLEGVQIVMTLDSVTENMNLKDDQFQVKIPAEAQIQTLD